MSLGNWTQYKSQAGLTIQIDVTTPVIGSGSLFLTNTGFATSQNFSNLLSTSYTPGITKGRARQIAYVTSGNKARFGFSFMNSVANITGNSGVNWYEAGPYIDGATRKFRIVRVVGSESAGTTVIFDSIATWSLSTVIPFQIEWIADSFNLGGTRLILSVGTLADFSDLVIIYDAIDFNPNALLTSAGEGPMVTHWDTGGDVYAVRFDQTSIFAYV